MKLKLDLDELQVESFATTPTKGRNGQGTVYANASLICSNRTCEEPTMKETCGDNFTCLATCPNTCDTCPISCDGDCNPGGGGQTQGGNTCFEFITCTGGCACPL